MSEGPVSSFEVAVAGGHIYVETAGEGPPLILIHGWSLDHRLFQMQVETLRHSVRAIVYDRRGFGRSDAEPDLDRELDDIDRLLDALGLESAHVLGMSQGGRIALRYAATRSERVRSLILQGAPVDGIAIEATEIEQVPVREYADLARANRLDAVKTRWLRHPMMQLHGAEAEVRHLVEKILDDYEGRDLLSHPPEAPASHVDVTARMSRFERPVLLLTGAEETAARQQQAAELLRLLPDGREIVLANSGHLSNLTEPGAYNRAVLDFVRSAEQS